MNQHANYMECVKVPEFCRNLWAQAYTDNQLNQFHIPKQHAFPRTVPRVRQLALGHRGIPAQGLNHILQNAN